jgi:RimJ/RimL family protein N-acetyltransferase
MTIPLRNVVLSALRRYKEVGAAPETIFPLIQMRKVVGRLTPVSWADSERPETAALLARWRETANPYFPSQFPVTLEGTQRWLVKGLLETPDRILFWVKAADGRFIGHVGLFRFDFDQMSAEVDNIVRGEEGVLPGVMQTAIDALLGWSFGALGLRTTTLRVMSDNERAVQLYQRLGYQEIGRVPLKREQEGAVVHWVERAAPTGEPGERFFVTMRLKKSEWRAVGPRAAAA